MTFHWVLRLLMAFRVLLDDHEFARLMTVFNRLLVERGEWGEEGE